MVAVTMFSQVMDQMNKELSTSGFPRPHPAGYVSSAPTPKKLAWKLDETVLEAVEVAACNMRKLISVSGTSGLGNMALVHVVFSSLATKALPVAAPAGEWSLRHTEIILPAATMCPCVPVKVVSSSLPCMQTVDLAVLEFTHYGKGFMKRHRLMPDFFVQQVSCR
jgi:hypothetical protein